jgi:hypothetical protein
VYIGGVCVGIPVTGVLVPPLAAVTPKVPNKPKLAFKILIICSSVKPNSLVFLSGVVGGVVGVIGVGVTVGITGGNITGGGSLGAVTVTVGTVGTVGVVTTGGVTVGITGGNITGGSKLGVVTVTVGIVEVVLSSVCDVGVVVCVVTGATAVDTPERAFTRAVFVLSPNIKPVFPVIETVGKVVCVDAKLLNTPPVLIGG